MLVVLMMPAHELMGAMPNWGAPLASGAEAPQMIWAQLVPWRSLRSEFRFPVSGFAVMFGELVLKL